MDVCFLPFWATFPTDTKKAGGCAGVLEGGRMMLDKLSLVLVIVGAINWALIGIFQFDLVAFLFGGQAAVISRIVYTLVGAAGLWCISLLFGERAAVKE